MSTLAAALPKTKGGAFLVEERAPARDLHARGFHRRAPRHRPHRRRVLGPGRRPQPGGHPAPGAGRRRSTCSARRPNWASPPCEVPEEYGGMEMDLTSGMMVAEHMARDGSLRGRLRRPHRHRHAAPAAVRHRRAEAEVPAPAGQPANGWRPTRSPSRTPAPTRWPRAPAPTSPRTARTTSSTARRCGSPTAASPTCSPSSPRWTASKFTAFLVERAFPASAAAPRKRRWASRAAPPRPSTSTTCRCRSRTCWARSAAATSSPSTFSTSAGCKLGPFAVGGCKDVLAESIRSTPRSARRSARPIARVRHDPHKLAEMAIRIFAAESMV